MPVGLVRCSSRFFHSRERAAAGLCPSPPILIRYLSDHLAVWICFPLSHTAGSASVILHHFAKRRTTRYIPILSSVPFFPQRFYDRGKISGRNRTVDEIVDQPVLLRLAHLVRQLLFSVFIHYFRFGDRKVIFGDEIGDSSRFGPLNQ